MSTQTATHQPPRPVPDVQAHFGLAGAPFTREISTQKMWRQPGLDDLVRDLEATVSARDSAAVIAPSGAGKTVLIRRLVDSLPEARYRVADIKVTSVGNRDLYRSLARALGIEPSGTWPALLESLQTHAHALATTEARRTVLIIDEAQDMRPQVLATLRMLTNFRLDSELLISLILVGDSGLELLLHRPDMEALRSRLACVIRIRLLSRSETRSYIDHRLDIVGARSRVLDDSAVEAVYDFTRGNIRAIDHLCRTALDLAARSTVDTIDAGTITAARKKLP
ncbi:MAG: AAA family ATPase [Anaerosomatales bacterium]|nr:AAA family ATPase [Anaerosomatales bacterium]